jgi:hypothetical protein
MNRDDIEQWTREAGGFDATPEFLAKFANLVASAEREVWEHKYARLQSLMDIRETQPNKPCCLAEREACAEVCKKHADVYAGIEQSPATQSAWAACIDNHDFIRARGQA